LLAHGDCPHAILVPFGILEMLLARIRMSRVDRRSSFFRRTIQEVNCIAFNAAGTACEDSNVRHGHHS
jgi:hypothetical protein